MTVESKTCAKEDTMNEIRYRASEDQLLEELMRRREAFKLIGADRIRCDKCGMGHYVIPNIVDRTFECEQCWAKRRYIEIVNGDNMDDVENESKATTKVPLDVEKETKATVKVPLDVEDFCRL